MDSNIQVSVISKLEKEDFLIANKVISKIKSKEIKWIINIITLIIVCIYVVIGIIEANNSSNIKIVEAPRNNLSLAPWYISLLPALFFIVFIIGVIIHLIWAKSYYPKKHYESNKLIQNEAEYTFCNEGMEYKSERMIYKILWSEIYKTYISKDFFVLYISDQSVMILPKRNINQNSINIIDELIDNNMLKKKIKRYNI